MFWSFSIFALSLSKKLRKKYFHHQKLSSIISNHFLTFFLVSLQNFSPKTVKLFHLHTLVTAQAACWVGPGDAAIAKNPL